MGYMKRLMNMVKYTSDQIGKKERSMGYLKYIMVIVEYLKD